MIGVEPAAQEYDGDDPLDFVIRANLKRRQLNESQRAMVAAKIANLERGRPALNPSIDGFTTQSDAAELLNVGTKSVERARKVQNEGAPELVAAVESGSVSVSSAAIVATLPEDEQREAVESEAVAARAISRSGPVTCN